MLFESQVIYSEFDHFSRFESEIFEDNYHEEFTSLKKASICLLDPETSSFTDLDNDDLIDTLDFIGHKKMKKIKKLGKNPKDYVFSEKRKNINKNLKDRKNFMKYFHKNKTVTTNIFDFCKIEEELNHIDLLTNA